MRLEKAPWSFHESVSSAFLCACLMHHHHRELSVVSEVGKASNSRLVACFSTLYLFCKVKPELLVPHCIIIQPYLDIKCTVCHFTIIIISAIIIINFTTIIIIIIAIIIIIL